MHGAFGLRAGLATVALGCVVVAASAATVQRLDFKGLTALSTHVVIGTIGDARCERTPDGGLIVTLTEVALAEQWKGQIGSAAITVRTPGGMLGTEIQETPGVPALAKGESALLFLEQNADGTFGVVSFAQGSYKLAVGADGVEYAARDAGARALVATDGAKSGPLAPELWRVAELKDIVAAAVRTAAEAVEAEVVTPLDDVDPETGAVEQGGGR